MWRAPARAEYYGFVAGAYGAVGENELSVKVVRAGVAYVKPGYKACFTLHSLLGDLLDKKGDSAAALGEFTEAKKACGECTDPLKGEHIAFFNLGRLQVASGDTTAGLGNLKKFNKTVCKTAMAQRYRSQCTQGASLARKAGGSID